LVKSKYFQNQIFNENTNHDNCVFSAGAIQRISVFGEDFGSDSILFLTILSMKQCMYVDVMPHECGDSRS
jgi:hypothetical protein